MQLGTGAGSPVRAAKIVYKEAGWKGMYAGLSAAITRQCVYTTLRVGLYDWIRVRPSDTRRLRTIQRDCRALVYLRKYFSGVRGCGSLERGDNPLT